MHWLLHITMSMLVMCMYVHPYMAIMLFANQNLEGSKTIIASDLICDREYFYSYYYYS